MDLRYLERVLENNTIRQFETTSFVSNFSPGPTCSQLKKYHDLNEKVKDRDLWMNHWV